MHSALVALVAFFIEFSDHPYYHSGLDVQLRWILAGVALSVLPYLFYVLSVFLRANILSNSTEILNYVASFNLVLFPVFVVIGVVRYNLFDIDQFLNRFTRQTIARRCVVIIDIFKKEDTQWLLYRGWVPMIACMSSSAP